MLDGWTYRKQITIDHTKIDSNLTDFPVLVKLTSSNFDFSKARSDGYDIRFCSPDESTLYKYERERHDSSSQVAEYWVKIPSISSSSDTTFWIEYGNASASDGADPTNAWDSNFKGVWHMTDANGTTGAVKDSTANANNGTKLSANEPANTDGKIERAQDFDGSNDKITIPDSNSLDITSAITIEAWVKFDSLATFKTIVSKSSASQINYQLRNDYNASTIQFGFRDSGGIFRAAVSTLTVSTGTFVYVAATFQRPNVNFYVNGASDSANPVSLDYSMVSNNYPLYMGVENNDSWFFDGIIDEVRISNVVRSAAWIKASYHSGNDTLLSFGSEEVNSIIFAPVQTITAYSLSPNVFSSITIPVPTQVISFSQFIPDILSKWRGILKHKTLWSGISKHSSSWDNLAKSSAPYLWSSGYYPWGSDKYPWLKYGGFQTIKKS
jgi:hypothetical protein